MHKDMHYYKSKQILCCMATLVYAPFMSGT